MPRSADIGRFLANADDDDSVRQVCGIIDDTSSTTFGKHRAKRSSAPAGLGLNSAYVAGSHEQLDTNTLRAHGEIVFSWIVWKGNTRDHVPIVDVGRISALARIKSAVSTSGVQVIIFGNETFIDRAPILMAGDHV
jgi:hypothetical protein